MLKFCNISYKETEKIVQIKRKMAVSVQKWNGCRTTKTEKGNSAT